MSLKRRLMLAATYVLVVVTIGLEVPLALTVSKREIQLATTRVLSYSALLAARINDDLGNPAINVRPAVGSPPRRAIADLVRITAAETNLYGTRIRYVVVNENGRLVADSDGLEPVGTQYRTPERPEFDEVFGKAGGDIFADTRSSATLRQDLLIVAVPVVHFREAIGAVRATVPLNAVQSKVRATWLGYGIVGLVAILVGSSRGPSSVRFAGWRTPRCDLAAGIWTPGRIRRVPRRSPRWVPPSIRWPRPCRRTSAPRRTSWPTPPISSEPP